MLRLCGCFIMSIALNRSSDSDTGYHQCFVYRQKTVVTNPVTGESDMEGVFALSADNQFTNPLRQGGTLDSGRTFWGGILVQVIEKSIDSMSIVAQCQDIMQLRIACMTSHEIFPHDSRDVTTIHTVEMGLNTKAVSCRQSLLLLGKACWFIVVSTVRIINTR